MKKGQSTSLIVLVITVLFSVSLVSYLVTRPDVEVIKIEPQKQILPELPIEPVVEIEEPKKQEQIVLPEGEPVIPEEQTLEEVPITEGDEESEEEPEIFEDKSYPNSYQMGVLVIKYFPTRMVDGQEVIDISVTGDVGEPYELIRQRTTDVTNNLVLSLEKASTYLGYKDENAEPSLDYFIVDVIEHKERVPTRSLPDRPRYPDYPSIMDDHDVCDYVDDKGAREVWLFAYQGPPKSDGHAYLKISESRMGSSFGDISNSQRDNDLPVCSNTYRLYTFNYQRGTAEAMESWGHQMEAELDYVDADFFRNKFQGIPYPQANNVNGRCGSVHNPPNARFEYDRENPTSQKSDCLDWDPDGLGDLTDISCRNWGCVNNGDSDNPSLNYMIWNWQNLPGKDNSKSYRGKRIRNLWDVHGDFDSAAENPTLFSS